MEEQLNIFKQFLEEDEWVREQRAKWKEEGFEEGKQVGLTKGEAHALETIALKIALLSLIKVHYPSLLEWAQEKLSSIRELDMPDSVIWEMLDTPDEAITRFILEWKEQGFTEGEIRTIRQMLVSMVSRRYPALKTLAQQQIAQIEQADKLHEGMDLIATATNEAMVRYILNTLPKS